MERKKMTKALIGESLKVLMRNHPFEKITIKMITDEAGVIRPTFYNYFCDTVSYTHLTLPTTSRV